ncbi:MAG: hypothetical protein DWI58_13495 [Chloroflexi bacterium]|nr:MAG: hypothetical protein DWI58_13495 [Chloroflexota bacterium]
MAEPRIAIGSVGAPPDVPYTRVLVSHRWPRGARGNVDQWEPALGPTPESLSAGSTSEIATQYREALASRAHLVQWAARMAMANGVTLLAADEDEARVLDVLADAIRAAAADLA